jgi:Tfp pilus assembly protein PilF
MNSASFRPLFSVQVLLRACALVGALLASLGCSAQANSYDDGCGALENGFGPFDYRKVSAADLQLVESHHFTLAVETLQHGNEGSIGGDLDYTLRVLPNHPRALLAMVRLAQREKTPRPNGSRYAVQCWFDRAVRLAPDDVLVRTLYGSYLADQGEHAAALAQLQVAQDGAAADDMNVQYNLGLAYFKLKEYDRSLDHAQKAYAMGFPLPGLRKMLMAAGKWRDAPATRDGSAAPAKPD